MGFAGSKCQPGNPGEKPLKQDKENESSEKNLVIPESKLKEKLDNLYQDLLSSNRSTTKS